MIHDQDRVLAFVERLPKCEMHLHFEGAVPMELVRRWCSEPIPERPQWRERDHRFEGLATDFSEVMRVTWKGTCDSLERIDAISTHIYRNLCEQNVRYLEMSFGIGAYPYAPSETLSAFKSGIPDGMTVSIVGALSRDRDIPTIRDAALGYIDEPLLDGVDIHGNESVGDPGVFTDFYETSRERNLILKAHAGEMCGPESVEEMLDKLGVDRIEHGIRCIESETLMKRCVESGVTLDVCPWSNVKLGFWPDLASHPIADLHRSGVRVTVNTDDPTPFGQTLTDEYTWLLTERGMSFQEVGAIARNAFQVARLDEGVRIQALKEIEELVDLYAGEDGDAG